MNRGARTAAVAWLVTAVYYFYQYALRSAPSVMIPELTGAFGVNTLIYAIAGAGFVPATTTVAIGAAPLVRSAAPIPNAGEFSVDAAGTAISFKLPSPPPPSGSYPVLVQVNGIAAHPGWIVSVP